MSKIFKDEEINLDLVQDIYNAAADDFCNGIYVPASKDNGHPCGWDFISFEMIDNDNSANNIFTHVFDASTYEISNGFGSIEYSDKTLLEILKICHGEVAFEKNQIDW